MLKVENTSARISLCRVFEKLTLDELKPLLKDIFGLAEANERVSGMGEELFHRASFIVMLEYRVKEGLDLVDINLGAEGLMIRREGTSFGNARFLTKALPLLAVYGPAAREYLPLLNEVQDKYRKERLGKVADLAAETIRKIENGAPARMIGIEESSK